MYVPESTLRVKLLRFYPKFHAHRNGFIAFDELQIFFFFFVFMELDLLLPFGFCPQRKNS